MDILEQIFQERRVDVQKAKEAVSIDELKSMAVERVHHSLVDKLADSTKTNIIAEMKKASPSAGCLREDYRPAELARLYSENGAAGISVLTEPRHFLGSEEHLKAVRAEVDLPILRKDFMCDVYQVYEAAAWGADVILLIAAGLDDDLMRNLYDTAIECGLDVLAEAHNAAEIERILGLEKALIGVNSRNLRTLKTDLSVARELSAMIPEARISVAESGIKQKSDIAMLKKSQYNAFLIGESILKQGNPARALTGLIS